MRSFPAGRSTARVAVWAALATWASGCGGKIEDVSQGLTNPKGEPPPRVATAAIRAQVQLPAGVSFSALNSFTYTLSGAGGFLRSATQGVAGDAIGFDIASLPAPARYTLDLKASSRDASEACTSSAVFDVSPNQDVVVVLIAQCTGAPLGASPGLQANSSSVGSLSVHLANPTGALIGQLACSVKGPNGLDDETVLSLGGDPSANFTLNNIAQGQGETLLLRGTSTNGQVCTATSTFSVLARQTTQTSLVLLCN